MSADDAMPPSVPIRVDPWFSSRAGRIESRAERLSDPTHRPGTAMRYLRTRSETPLWAWTALLFVLTSCLVAAEPDDSEDSRPSRRHFRFIYAGTIESVPPGATARVWLPVATDRFGQKIHEVKISAPGEFRRTRELRFGNPLLYFEAEPDAAGRIAFRVEYIVDRMERTSNDAEAVTTHDRQLFLSESRLVPHDPKLLAQLLPRHENTRPHRELARSLYDAVEQRMRYEKPLGGAWGRGDAVWACSSGYGNCTDYHSLFLAAGYAAGMPGRFEIGFLLPADKSSGTIDGYHCWAFFADDDHWIPVDISEADKRPEQKEYYFGNLTPDRITFSVGRDLQLDPPPTDAEPVNFLVYPHVEVDGQQHSAFTPQFRFADVDANDAPGAETR